MFKINSKSINIANFEETTGKNIFTVIGYSHNLAIKFLQVATGVFEEEKRAEIADYLDELKKEKGCLENVVDFLIDTCDAEGFFPRGLTAEMLKKLLKDGQQAWLDKMMQSEEEQMQTMIIEGLKKLQAEQNKTSGTKTGKK